MYFFLLLSIWSGDWTNSGLDELLLRTDRRSSMFPGTGTIEKGELRYFLSASTDRDSSAAWLKQRLSATLPNCEQLEWKSGATRDSLNQAFVLFGKGAKSRFAGFFVQPVVTFGDTCGYPLDKWRGVAACDYLKGYIKTSLFGFTLAVGREPIKWGPSPRNTLLMSGSAPHFDLIRGSYRSAKLKTSFFSTILEPRAGANRYLSGHRVEYGFGQKLYVGFSETALFGGENRAPRVYYFNPLFLYFPSESNRDVNVLWALDFNLLLRGLGVYGEFMVDDLPGDQAEHGEHPRIGINAGVKGTLPKTYCLVEYSTATRWTYSHRTAWQRYGYRGYPIGHPIGTDFDEIFCGVVHHLTRDLDATASATWLRRGEGLLNEPYPFGQFPTSYWLTGDVERTSEFEVGMKWHKPKFVLTFSGGCVTNGEEIFPKLSFSISNWR
jgi:hypothetical protein